VAARRPYGELLTHEPVALTTFANDAGYDELVVVREIPFHSLCMHHLLPFHGVAHIAYLPAARRRAHAPGVPVPCPGMT
jgi:GTP cyclohydrolase I